MNNTNICQVCGKEFNSASKNTKYCSHNCAVIHRSHIKFDDNADKKLYVECKICGYRSSQIYRHVHDVHNMEVDEYCQKFGLERRDLISTASHEKISKSQKTAYAEGRSHGWGFGDENPSRSIETKSGRRSPWSMNFKGYDGLSDDEKRKRIKELSNNVVNSMNSNHNNPLRLDFYIQRGYTKQEAKQQLKLRQSTFSLKKCIDKYGLEEGTKRFDARQEKWQNTLKSKSPEEIDRINRAKLSDGKGYSKISQVLFNQLYDVIKHDYNNIYYATNGIDKNITNEFMVTTLDGRHYFLDFYILDNNKVIEFDGEYWHSEKRGNITKDKKREDELRSLGFVNILRIRERDFCDNPTDVIKRCLEFIRG